MVDQNPAKEQNPLLQNCQS